VKAATKARPRFAEHNALFICARSLCLAGLARKDFFKSTSPFYNRDPTGVVFDHGLAFLFTGSALRFAF